jgi:hypothetical protein
VTDQAGGGSPFNIGSQQAGVINNVAGDQIVTHGEGTLTIGLLDAVSEVRSVLATTPALSATEREHADSSLDAIEAELRRPEPDRARVAHGLTHVTKTLQQAGALAASAEALRWDSVCCRRCCRRSTRGDV